MEKILYILLLINQFSFSQSQRNKDAIKVAVMYFENNSSERKLDPLKKGISAMLISDLSNINMLDVVERDRIQDLINEQKLQKSRKFDSSNAVEFGKLLGAEIILTGSYFEMFGTIRIDARFIDVMTGRIVKSDGVNGDISNFFNLEKELVRSIIENLDVKLSENEYQDLKYAEKNQIISYQLSLLFSKALDDIDNFKYKDATDKLREILAQNPTFIPAKDELTRLSSKNLIENLLSKVDINIPINPKVDNRYALIIGNEDYSSFQSELNYEQNVDFAENDAKIFKEYAINTLGVKEDNLYFLTNATLGQMKQKISLVCKILKEIGSSGELIFYYAGHGYPDELTKTPYLLPVDISANDIDSAIKLSNLYKELSVSTAGKITLFLDACFTGGARSQDLVASRGVKISPKNDELYNNIVVFSASSGTQSSLPFRENYHGMFTYFLLEGLQTTKGKCTYKELFDYLEEKVSLHSLKFNQKEQHPEVNTSQNVNAEWGGWKF